MLIPLIRNNTKVGRIQGEDSIINNYSDKYLNDFFKEKQITTKTACLTWAYEVQLEFLTRCLQRNKTLLSNPLLHYVYSPRSSLSNEDKLRQKSLKEKNNALIATIDELKMCIIKLYNGDIVAKF